MSNILNPSSAFVSPLGTGGVGSDVVIDGLDQAIMLYHGRVVAHENCLALLKRALLHVKFLWGVPGQLQLDVTVACLISLSDDIYGMALYTTLDVGGVEEFRGLHGWDGNCTDEAWFLTDFLGPCEGVEKYLSRPPLVGDTEEEGEDGYGGNRKPARPLSTATSKRRSLVPEPASHTAPTARTARFR